MEDWGMFRYLLPALGGGFSVYFLITQAKMTRLGYYPH